VRALLISDVHGNIDVLHALETQWGARFREFERIICLGDLVDYGPSPGDVIEWVRAHATHVVRGNHDHAVATGEPCKSATAFLEASVLTRLRLQPTLTEGQIDYLNSLPLTDTLTDPGLNGGAPLHLVHACPRSPLHEYMPPQRTDAEWSAALDDVNGATVLIGHTHVAFARLVGAGLVINPGSLGMPKDGNAHGSYAVLDGPSVQFCRIAYDPEPMLGRLQALKLPPHVFAQLAQTFRTGT